MRLAKGDIVRCRNDGNDVFGRVMLASGGNPQSVVVVSSLASDHIFRLNGAITDFVALTVDYEQKLVTDLWGGTWEIEIADRTQIEK